MAHTPYIVAQQLPQQPNFYHRPVYINLMPTFKRKFKHLDNICRIQADRIYFHWGNAYAPLHCRNRGDVHVLITQTYVEMGDNENALLWLEKMVDYDVNTRGKLKTYQRATIPFLPDLDFPYYHTFEGDKIRLLNKLNTP